MRRTTALILLLLLAVAAAEARESPEELLALKMQTQLLTETEGTMTGEDVAWHASWRAGDFVSFARETGDTAYLDGAVTYFDALIDKLHLAPDGYRGWVGPFIYDESVIGDVHISDGILVNHMLRFAEYVRTELPEAQRARYAAPVARYVALAEEVCRKWDERRTWWESGHAGGYVTWDRFLTDDDPPIWDRQKEVRTAGLGLQFNKQQSMGILHLRLFRITGSPEHRRRAQLIFQHTKSRLTLFEGHYTWNYWEPFYPGDVVSAEPAKLNLWVATHPGRNYQTGEVSEIVEAYHSGLVFDRTDIRRLIRTNLRMWNGSTDDPQFTNSDDAVSHAAVDGYTPYKSDYGRAGALWPALVEFDSTLARIAGREASNPGLERRYELPVTLFDWPFRESTYLSMVCVLPAAAMPGETLRLVSKARAPGMLLVQIMSADGQEVIETVYEGKTPGGADGLEGVLVKTWVGNQDPGSYRVRWTFTDGEGRREARDYPIEVLRAR